MPIQSYRDLIVWQRAMELVSEVYNLTDTFPKSEMYGLSSQMRRAVVSIPSNIAEGRRLGSKKEFRKFLTIAFGSGAELETQLDIAKEQAFCNAEVYGRAAGLLEEVMKMLNKMLKNLTS